jgi:hypothetical protein
MQLIKNTAETAARSELQLKSTEIKQAIETSQSLKIVLITLHYLGKTIIISNGGTLGNQLVTDVAFETFLLYFGTGKTIAGESQLNFLYCIRAVIRDAL